MQVRVPAVQVVMKTVEVPQVPFIDRRDAIQSVPQELNSRCNTEEIKDVTVPSVVREVFEVVRHIPHEQCLHRTVGKVDSVCHELSRTLKDTDFISGAQDICMSA